MSTWSDLIAEVRAQIDVEDDQALDWLLDRARVMNAASGWLLREATIPVTTAAVEYALPQDCVRTEALTLGGLVFQRSTLGSMDQARAAASPRAIYSDGVDAQGASLIAIWPPSSGDLILRYLADVPAPATPASESPPFPADVHGGLSDGAIGIGLARMDERFDSASYFDARFTDATGRLKLRRHGHMGRGGTPIRIVS
jgi:hypothetical protein